jgi:hypothetical protein
MAKKERVLDALDIEAMIIGFEVMRDRIINKMMEIHQMLAEEEEIPAQPVMAPNVYCLEDTLEEERPVIKEETI